MAIRIVLADDHSVLRESLAVLLRTEDGVEIAGQASDGEEAVRLARETLGLDLRAAKEWVAEAEKRAA